MNLIGSVAQRLQQKENKVSFLIRTAALLAGIRTAPKLVVIAHLMLKIASPIVMLYRRPLVTSWPVCGLRRPGATAQVRPLARADAKPT